jgi:hypothetical protein
VSLTRSQIDAAVAHKGWQDFRKSLKGKSTMRKLALLEAYHFAVEYSAKPRVFKTDWERVFGKPPKREQARVQIINYLNALSRGGQIEPLSKQDWSFDELGLLLNDELDDRIKIRR